MYAYVCASALFWLQALYCVCGPHPMKIGTELTTESVSHAVWVVLGSVKLLGDIYRHYLAVHDPLSLLSLITIFIANIWQLRARIGPHCRSY